MQVTTETFGNTMVMHTPDELTEDTTGALVDAMEEAIGRGLVRIVAQMDRTDLYDSVGLTTLLDMQDKLRENEGNLKISGLGDPGRTIFATTRLDRRFDLFDSVIDAVRSFQ